MEGKLMGTKSLEGEQVFTGGCLVGGRGGVFDGKEGGGLFDGRKEGLFDEREGRGGGCLMGGGGCLVGRRGVV